MNILHIDSSALGDNSASRQLTAAAVASLCNHDKRARVVYRDLAATPLSHVSGPLLQVMRSQWDKSIPMNQELSAEAMQSESLLAEFLDADLLVVGAPMYNFSVPSTLKAWLDRIVQVGRTFSYGENGNPQGLALGKRVVVVSTRGGPMAGRPHEVLMDHQEAYLKAVFGFLGVAEISVVRAEGIGIGPEARALAIEGALRQAAELRAA